MAAANPNPYLTPALRLKLQTYKSKPAKAADNKSDAELSEMPDPSLFDTHELIASGRVGPKARRVTLRISDPRDFDRTVMRSDAASLSIPALKIDNPDGTGRFASVRDVLLQMASGVETGLSFSGQLGTAAGQRIMNAMREYTSGAVPCTLVMDDPIGISSISSITGLESHLTVEEYDRSWAQMEEFGLHTRAYSVDTKQQTADSTIDGLAKLIARCNKIVVFTGAGISTESAIPAFWIDDVTNERSLRSVWNTYPHDQFTEPLLRSTASIRTKYWEMDRSLFGTFMKAAANPAHLFLVWLHQHKKLQSVITQNIDGLHIRSGLPASKVRELHGNSWTVSCRACKAVYQHTAIHERLVKGGETDPKCTAAGCGGVLLPDVVHFGAALDTKLLELARSDVASCDLMLGIGSSFFVEPANTLPADVIMRRIPFVLLNKSVTKFDPFATIKMSAPCGQVLGAVQQILDKSATATSTTATAASGTAADAKSKK